MKQSKKTTSLNILERIGDADDLFSATVSKSEFLIFKELEASSYIEGQIGPIAHDEPDTIIEGVGFTSEGRLLMERLQKEKKEAGFLATTWRWLGPVVGFIAGIGAPLATDLLRKILKL